MTESVTDIIVARSQRHERVGLTIAGSTVAHAAVLAIVVLLPHGPADEPPPRQVMTISLGGAVGPRTGGLTPIGGRAVQEVAPPEPQKRVEARPAATPPKMTVAAPKAPAPRRETRKVPEMAPAPPPTTGEQVTEGSTPIDTGVRGAGFGVSSAGGSGGPVTLDVTDFCCSEYLELMIVNIRRNWQQDQGRTGPESVIKFTIRRDGSIDAVAVDRPSGFAALDLAAQRAVQLTSLPQLPRAFPNPTLTVHMTFRY